MHQKQVDRDHYRFGKYLGKKRWASIWHQLDETLSMEPHGVLEVGPGPGIFQAVAGLYGVTVETLDLDPELAPDHVASATDMPFSDNEYDAVCAFQMLEHLPFDQSRTVFAEMARVARRKLVISLPDARRVWRYLFYIPSRGDRRLLVPRPQLKPQIHQFDGQHYWEINKAGYELKTVTSALCEAGDVQLEKTYRVTEFPYHRFFVFALES